MSLVTFDDITCHWMTLYDITCHLMTSVVLLLSFPKFVVKIFLGEAIRYKAKCPSVRESVCLWVCELWIKLPTQLKMSLSDTRSWFRMMSRMTLRIKANWSSAFRVNIEYRHYATETTKTRNTLSSAKVFPMNRGVYKLILRKESWSSGEGWLPN